MSNAAKLGFLLAGLLAGSLVAASVARWIHVLGEILREPRASGARTAVAARLALATTLSSGPWLVAVLAFVAYHLRNQPWIQWALAGFLLALAFLGLFIAHVRRKGPRELPARSGVLFPYVLGMVSSLAVVPVMYEDLAAPTFVWVFLVFWGLLLGYMGQRLDQELDKQKPWPTQKSWPAQRPWSGGEKHPDG